MIVKENVNIYVMRQMLFDRYVIILDPAIKIEDGYEPYDSGVRDGVFVMEKDGVTPAVSRVYERQ